MDTQDAQALQLNAIRNAGFVIQFFQAGSGAADCVTFQTWWLSKMTTEI